MLTQEAVVQIHATRFCNYACLHCYSSSSPDARDSLSLTSLLSLTGRLADEGYRRASLSGGEPVLFDDFAGLVAGLAEQGYDTSVISNGTRPQRLLRAMRAGHVHHASISFDGFEDLHDTVRQKKGAFRRAQKALSVLLEDGQSTGAVVSVTQHSLPMLPALVADLAARGVQHIQLHPLAAVGRATMSARTIGGELPQEALMRLTLMTLVLRVLHKGVRIHCDTISGAVLKDQIGQPEGQIISPVVIRDDGWVVPYSYDTSRAFTLGHIDKAALRCRVDHRLAATIAQAVEMCATQPITTFYREFVAASKIQVFAE